MAVIWSNLVSEAIALGPTLAARIAENTANLESADLRTAEAARTGKLELDGLNLLCDLIKYMDEQQVAPAREADPRVPVGWPRT